MCGVNALRVAAQVVKLRSVRHFTVAHLPRNNVGVSQLERITAADLKHSVTGRRGCSEPQPAGICSGRKNVVFKSLFERAHRPSHRAILSQIQQKEEY
jgi:hypothetical protein